MNSPAAAPSPPNPLQFWLFGPWIAQQFTTINATLAAIQTQIGKLMAAVQLDDSVLATAVTDIEALVTASNALSAAVTTFLASPAAASLPAADITALTSAEADASAAQANAGNSLTALQGATPAPPPGP